MSKTAKQQPDGITIRQTADESGGLAFARTLLEPNIRHGHAARAFGADWISAPDKPALMDYADWIGAVGDKAAKGDLAIASRIMAAQAVTLDAMFTELARRAALNMGQHMDAADRYLRLALKAQANSRATIEALAKLHQPREQTVRHVHVSDGGQAIVAENFHHHAGGRTNAESVKQSHATGAVGQRAALPCTSAIGDSLPSTCGEGKEAVPDARRD